MRRFLLSMAVLAVAAPALAAPKSLPVTAFSFDVPVTVPGTPAETFDAATGDISGWWDHSFSKHPKAFYLEPKAGGAFMEIFDDNGNGVKHASVIYCERPKAIRFEGPLGLSGHAIQMVFTYTFEAAGADSTTLTLHAEGCGGVEAGTAEIVERVWRHFLIERFKPYVESGKQGTKQ